MTVNNHQQQVTKRSLWQAIANWQTLRGWWLLSAFVALAMNLIAHYIFQGAMAMEPCEKCVYIRYAMFCIVFAGLITTINPKMLMLRLVGYLGTLYGAIWGAIWSWQLVQSYRLMQAPPEVSDPFAAGFSLTSCKTEPVFHFNLPLDKWFPDWFAPKGVCGIDTWSFLGLDMGSWTLVIFVTYIVLVTLSILASLLACKQR